MAAFVLRALSRVRLTLGAARGGTAPLYGTVSYSGGYYGGVPAGSVTLRVKSARTAGTQAVAK